MHRKYWLLIILNLTFDVCAGAALANSNCSLLTWSAFDYPTQASFSRLAHEPSYWLSINQTPYKVGRLRNIIEKGNPWAAKYLASNLSKSDGGNLEDYYISLGVIFDHSPKSLLGIHRDGILLDLSIKRSVTMLNLAISDAYDRQLSIINSRLSSLDKIHEKSLSHSVRIASTALREFKVPIEDALHER